MNRRSRFLLGASVALVTVVTLHLTVGDRLHGDRFGNHRFGCGENHDRYNRGADRPADRQSDDSRENFLNQ